MCLWPVKLLVSALYSAKLAEVLNDIVEAEEEILPPLALQGLRVVVTPLLVEQQRKGASAVCDARGRDLRNQTIPVAKLRDQRSPRSAIPVLMNESAPMKCAW